MMEVSYCWLLTLLLAAVYSITIDPQEYLARYGYLKSEPSAAIDPEFGIEDAILKFQDYNELPLTGQLDETTLQLMNTARCGMEDDIPSSAGRIKRYAIASRWRKRDLNYVIGKYPLDVTTGKLDSIIASAFVLWQRSADLRINRVEREEDADIVVSFVRKSHSTNRTVHVDKRFSFDGPGGVLAHASFPSTGEVHFDDDENWIVEGVNSEGELGYNLKWAAVHELGHALGLRHTRVRGNVMNPIYKKVGIDELGEDDKNGIVRLYGAPRRRITEKVEVTHTTVGQVVEEDAACQAPNSTDAVLTLGQTMYMFRGSLVWVSTPDRSSKSLYPQPIEDLFPGITGPVTAAMAGIDNKIYFFRDRHYWRWDSMMKQVDRGFPRNVAGFGYIQDDVIAAFRWNHNGKAYLFGAGCRYWRYDFFNKRMDPGYPKSTKFWTGVPNDLDDISVGPDGKTYIFKGKDFYVYNNELYRVPEGQVFSQTKKWKCCTQSPAQNEVARLEAGSESAAQLPSLRVCILLLIFFLVA